MAASFVPPMRYYPALFTCLLTPALSACSPFLPYECNRTEPWIDPLPDRILARATPQPLDPPYREPPQFSLRSLPLMDNSLNYKHLTYAKEVFDDLGFLKADSLEGALLICFVQLKRPHGHDGLIFSSLPDLLVHATFGNERWRSGYESSSDRGWFPFHTRLRAGSSISIVAADYDVFSPDDYLGRATSTYPGVLPLKFASDNLVVDCRGMSTQDVSARTDTLLKGIHQDLSRFESHKPTIDNPVLWEAISGIDDKLDRVGFYTGQAHPMAKEASKRIDVAGKAHWGEYIKQLEALQAKLPPPGTWTGLNADVDARVKGLICQSGQHVADACHIELEVRIRSENTKICPAERNRVGQIGPFVLYFTNGETDNAIVAYVHRAGKVVQHQQELVSPDAGEVLSIELESQQRSMSHSGGAKDWRVPLVRISGKFLRVY